MAADAVDPTVAVLKLAIADGRLEADRAVGRPRAGDLPGQRARERAAAAGNRQRHVAGNRTAGAAPYVPGGADGGGAATAVDAAIPGQPDPTVGPRLDAACASGRDRAERRLHDGLETLELQGAQRQGRQPAPLSPSLSQGPDEAADPDGLAVDHRLQADATQFECVNRAPPQLLQGVAGGHLGDGHQVTVAETQIPDDEAREVEAVDRQPRRAQPGRLGRPGDQPGRRRSAKQPEPRASRRQHDDADQQSGHDPAQPTSQETG